VAGHSWGRGLIDRSATMPNRTGAEGAASPAAGLEAWEQRLWADGNSVVAGTDEAGRGPLAGPVVAAAFAVIAHDDEEVRALLASVADSKQMTAQQREDAFSSLTDPKFDGRFVWAIAEASVEEIDGANILRAALSAMARSVRALTSRPDVVLVDGCNRPPELLAPGEQWTRGPKKAEEDERKQPKLMKWFAPRAAPKPEVEKPQQAPEVASAEDLAAAWRPRRVEAVIEGDGRVPSISAASVLAKVHRDRQMEKLHEQYPHYGFNSHKGYGTEAHLQAIKVHGVCPEHRRSFGPVREALGLSSEPEQPKPAGNIRLFLGGAASSCDNGSSSEKGSTPEPLAGGNVAPKPSIDSTPTARGGKATAPASGKKAPRGKRPCGNEASETSAPAVKQAKTGRAAPPAAEAVPAAAAEENEASSQKRAVRRRLTKKS